MSLSSVSLTPVGIDVSKRTVDVCVSVQGKWYSKQMSNEEQGHREVLRWLSQYGLSPQQVHVGLEATGPYSDSLALFLHEQGVVVSVLNPARVAAFRTSEGVRTKTDRYDARLLARLVQQKHPAAWTPTPIEVQALQCLLRRQEQLEHMKQQEVNHLENSRLDELTRADIQAHLQFVQAQMQQTQQRIMALMEKEQELQDACERLESIPGIGAVTARRVLAALVDIKRFESASQLVAYAGVAPAERSSGTSVRGKAGIDKGGHALLRKWLYMSALRLMRDSHDFGQWVQQLKARGKKGLVIVVAIMRKLLHVIYGVLKSQQPYDPRKAFPAHYPDQDVLPAVGTA